MTHHERIEAVTAARPTDEQRAAAESYRAAMERFRIELACNETSDNPPSLAVFLATRERAAYERGFEQAREMAAHEAGSVRVPMTPDGVHNMRENVTAIKALRPEPGE